jgi:hypothetical protein
MYLNTVSATTQDAFIAVAFSCCSSLRLPFTNIRSHLTTTPETAVLTLHHAREVFIQAYSFTTSFLIVTWICFKRLIAYNAISRFFACAVPSAYSITLSRAILSIYVYFRNIERLIAYLTNLFGSIARLAFCAFQPFIPRLMPLIQIVAFLRTIYTAFMSNVFSVALLAVTYNLSQPLLLKSWYRAILSRNKKYVNIAIARIQQFPPNSLFADMEVS